MKDNNTTQKRDWEGRFDEKYPNILYDSKEGTGENERIKSFISQELQQAEQRGAKREREQMIDLFYELLDGDNDSDFVKTEPVEFRRGYCYFRHEMIEAVSKILEAVKNPLTPKESQGENRLTDVDPSDPILKNPNVIKVSQGESKE